jgi:hypothetical protein
MAVTATAHARAPVEDEVERTKRRYTMRDLVPRVVNDDLTTRVLESFADEKRTVLNENQLAALLALRQLSRKRGRIPLQQMMQRNWRRQHAMNGLTLNSLFSRRLIWFTEDKTGHIYVDVDQKVAH